MDIRKATYDLCKTISSVPARTQMADLIRSFHNTQIGYYGHRQYAQALGYLVVSQQRSKFEAKPFPEHIEALPEDQLKILAGFHKRLADLNERCAKPLTDSLPNCSLRALSPYNRFEYLAPTEVAEIEILTEDQTKDLVTAFHSHPKIGIAIESSSGIPPTFSQEYYMQNAWALEDDIKNARMEIPKQLEEMNLREQKESARRTFVRHIAAIMSVRGSLSVLNQMIYQKLFDDKLLVIDENNTIKFGAFHPSTGGSSVIFQHAGLLYLVEVGDIILLKTILLHSPTSKLCRVEILDPHIPLLDFGEPRYAELREIDENLDPYGLLFRAF